MEVRSTLEEKFWEDFSIGEKIRTWSITVTESHLVNWAGLTMDFYPLHMNKEWAKNTHFERRVAHGPLTFALSIGLLGSTGFLGDSVLGWLGLENMKIPAPVFIGDTITVEVEVKEKRETSKPEKGVTLMTYTILNQDGVKVMEYDNVFLMKRKK
jgi:acyl dehydratase